MLSDASFDPDFILVPLSDIAHQLSIVERYASRINHVFIGNDVVYLKAIEIGKDERVGQHMLWIEIVEIISLDIRMIPHKAVGLADEF